jgi:hypothetical protein
MPLHVDRTTVHTHQSRGEHVLELAAARARQAAAGPDAAKQQDDASPVLRLMSTPDPGDVDSIEQAEKLVRSMFGGGADKALAAHGALDPNRVSALLAG